MQLNLANHHRYMYLMSRIRLGRTLTEAEIKWVNEYQTALYEFEKDCG